MKVTDLKVGHKVIWNEWFKQKQGWIYKISGETIYTYFISEHSKRAIKKAHTQNILPIIGIKLMTKVEEVTY